IKIQAFGFGANGVGQIVPPPVQAANGGGQFVPPPVNAYNRLAYAPLADLYPPQDHRGYERQVMMRQPSRSLRWCRKGNNCNNPTCGWFHEGQSLAEDCRIIKRQNRRGGGGGGRAGRGRGAGGRGGRNGNAIYHFHNY
ncbi:hypothetical protein RF55_25930, partial [Lasius niger]